MSVGKAGDDPVIKQFRDQISDNDLKIIDAVNKRLKLVKQLKAYKEQHSVDFLDPAREEWMLTFVARANKGPLSPDAVAELYRSIVEITKREAAQS
jgi:chorismate mutase/prephenate dehydratase